MVVGRSLQNKLGAATSSAAQLPANSSGQSFISTARKTPAYVLTLSTGIIDKLTW